MRMFLILSASAIALTACQGPSPSAHRSNAMLESSRPSGGLLPGEISGCNGLVCGGWKDGGE
jgi:hypothetical protein